MSATEPHYADQLECQTVRVELNEKIARDTFRLRFHCPAMASACVPGQFFMVRLSGYDDPLIGRPFAMFDTVDGVSGAAESLEFVYLVGGKLTSRLCQYGPGQEIDVWGPLGNGFAPVDDDHLILVAGGIGQTPFLSVAREFLGQRSYGGRRVSRPAGRRVTLCYGARNRDYFAGIDLFRTAGMDVRLSTDDGSLGHHGLVTELLTQLLSESSGQQRRILCCGPEPMMRAVAGIAAAHAVAAQVSLETPMACGIGICFSCVALVRDADGATDYRRTCVEGPVFDAKCLVWD